MIALWPFKWRRSSPLRTYLSFLQFEPLLRIETTVTPAGGVASTSLFALTANMVSSTLPPPAKLQAPPPTPSQQRQMKSRLKTTDVMLAAFLGTTRSTV